ncbi:MAG: phenylalanine--tRNA ligase subunit beta [Candidatus Cloacimonetes bacterium]|nr:phenylalanine--tRNA ligase subunit beta [Candidatus Cloacimonadota bacterium]
MNLRESKEGEKITTLDGVERELPVGSIIIDDGEKIIDLCGIMGGENSAISGKTRRVILFSQIYESTRIRQTSMKLNLRTEAAQRFEKGLDCEMVLPALVKAAEMLKEHASARIASDLINIRQKEFIPHKVSLSMQKLNNYLAIALKPKQVQDYLESLGFIPVKSGVILEPRRRRDDRIQHVGLDSIAALQNDTTLGFTVPSWRDSDIQIEEDLIEEVARLYGYYKIPSLLPAGRPPPAVQEKKFAIERRLKYLLKDLGFTEVYTYSMVKEAQTRGALKLRNPLTSDLTYMRLELIPSLVQVIEGNRARFSQMKIFEMANGYFPTTTGQLPKEKLFLACLMTAEKKTNQENFAVVKGFLETIFEELNIKDYTVKPSSTFPYGMDVYSFGPQNSAIVWPTKPIEAGKIITPVGRIKDDIWGFQIHVETLAELATETKVFHSIPQFPAVKQDLAFVVDKRVLAGDILEVIKQAAGKLLADVEIFDVFEAPLTFGKDKKSIAVHLTFQRLDRSLSGKEATAAREKIEGVLVEKFTAQIRKA